MGATSASLPVERLKTLPSDEIRQILWRFADRFDLQMVVQSVRAVARGPVARLVAEGGRHSHDWTEAKNNLLAEYDAAGITSAYMDPADGGYLEGPKNLALSLIAFELAWVDAGASTGSLASCLALAPIHERGTLEQRAKYMALAAPAPGKTPQRGAFCLTEPIPFVGVETGMLSGKVRVVDWPEGGEAVLEVNKRGRFITNMGFANFVTAAVESDDPRIQGTLMVILEQTDPGVFDRGTPTRKLVHQLSSTSDPVFQLTIPASRIVGGYEVVDGKIVPKYSHGEVLEAVFRRTRVMVGLMTSAKLLSAVEPLIRYHRDRFRGSGTVPPGSPRYELGLQQKEDVTHRLLDIWATGEASASLGFAAARLFDDLDPVERQKSAVLGAQGIAGGMAEFKALKKRYPEAIEFIELDGVSEALRAKGRYSQLSADPVVQYLAMDAVANVLCPATKLWNTGVGSQKMREAVSLMGGYGITEDCPGFLGLQMDGFAVGGHLRGPRGRAAAADVRHHDQRGVSGAVPQLDSRNAAARLAQSGHRRMHDRLRNGIVDLDAGAPAACQGLQWAETLPVQPAGSDVPDGGCAVLAFGFALPDSGPGGTEEERAGKPGGAGGSRWHPAVPHRPLPHSGRARGGRSQPDLR